MGGCYSKSSKKKDKDGNIHSSARLPLRPYFRSNSVNDTPYPGGLNDVWIERKVSEPPQNAPIVSIETVLHGAWWKDDNSWKDDTNYKDPDKGNFTKSPEDVRRNLPPLPSIPKVYIDDSDDDTYNVINEAEIDGTEVVESIVVRLPPTPTQPNPQMFKYISCPVHEDETDLSEDRTHPSPSPRSLHEDETDLYGDSNLNGGRTQADVEVYKFDAPLPTRPGYKPTKHITMTITAQSVSDSEPEYTQYGEEITEEQTKCFEYSEMVKIFKPLIIQNVRIHDILPHLSYLDNHEDIYELMKHHSEKESVLTMLDQLDKCNTLGKWHKFIDVLSACGYTYIVDNIRGYKFVNHHYQTEYLKILTPKIKNMIVPTELMPYLMAKNLISDTDRENILSDCNSYGNIHGAITLLDRVTRKHRNWYMLFIEALEEANFDEVAADLRIERLMGNGRVKDTDRERTVDRDEVPPPIPPRVPIIRNRHLFRNASHDTLDKSGVADDNIKSNGRVESNTNAVVNEAAQFQSLEDEISKLKDEEQELEVETCLLEKKSYHCEKVVDHLKKKNQLKYSIAILEKEREALRNAPTTIEESQADQLAADMYYPSRNISHIESTRRTGVLDLLHHLSVESQPMALNTDNEMSPVPVYSPTFDKTRIGLLQSDKDSALGTIYDYYEEMSYAIN